MPYVKKNPYFRKTKTFAIIKQNMIAFQKPDYIDTTQFGVSFKWYIRYYRENDFNKMNEKHIKKFIDPKYYDRLSFKYLDTNCRIYKEKELDWLENVLGPRTIIYPYSFRMLVNLEGAE